MQRPLRLNIELLSTDWSIACNDANCIAARATASITTRRTSVHFFPWTLLGPTSAALVPAHLLQRQRRRHRQRFQLAPTNTALLLRSTLCPLAEPAHVQRHRRGRQHRHQHLVAARLSWRSL